MPEFMFEAQGYVRMTIEAETFDDALVEAEGLLDDRGFRISPDQPRPDIKSLYAATYAGQMEHIEEEA
jgi:hypothetical protein